MDSTVVVHLDAKAVMGARDLNHKLDVVDLSLSQIALLGFEVLNELTDVF